MKQKLLFLLMALLSSMFSWADVEINETNFPDEKFRNWVLSQSYGADGMLTDDEIAGVTRIDIYRKNIQSLKGIEYFTALTILNCFDNQLASIDVSKNTALTSLDCYQNQLTSLDVSGCTALTYLECNTNQLTSLDVSGCTSLTELNCYNNRLTSLDVSQNTALTELRCYNNQLTSLDVSKNTALEILDCNSNQLTSLDVSKNTALIYLYCYNNQINGAEMDALVESLPILESGGVCVVINPGNDGNVITIVQVAAAKAKGWGIYYHDGINWQEYAGSDPDAKGIAINDENFPDENFRNWVRSQEYGWDGVLTDAEIAGITKIEVNNNNIQSLKGIEFFTAMTMLSFINTQLTSLDVSQNTALEYLHCPYNQLISLDVSGCTSLTQLDCNNNQLTSLDVSGCTSLKFLSCQINCLTSLNVSKNMALTTLDCNTNQLTSLDVSKNTALKTLYCYDNLLLSLDVSQNTSLTHLECHQNKIKNAGMDALVESLPTVDFKDDSWYWFDCIYAISNENEGNVMTAAQVAAANAKGWMVCFYSGSEWTEYVGSDPDATEIAINEENFPDEIFRNWVLSQDYGADGVLTDNEIVGIKVIKLNSKGISRLKGIEYFRALTELQCNRNQLTSLDVSKSTKLKILQCHNNQLTSIDVSKNTALTKLYCNTNQLTLLDVSQNTKLKYLHCHSNQLTSLDVSKNTALTELRCYQNQIKGAKMYSLVESLQTISNGIMYAIYSENEGNVMTTVQVAAANAKGWTVYYYDGSWKEYAGSEPDFVLGDVNGDGAISVTDVGMMISFILGQNPEGFNEDAADMNGDSEVTVTDVGALITKILSGE